jgi:hypothetical protein
VKTYCMTLRKKEDTLNWKGKNLIALCKEFALEELWICRKTDYRISLESLKFGSCPKNVILLFFNLFEFCWPSLIYLLLGWSLSQFKQNCTFLKPSTTDRTIFQSMNFLLTTLNLKSKLFRFNGFQFIYPW